jgi:hypothetical protein
MRAARKPRLALPVDLPADWADLVAGMTLRIDNPFSTEWLRQIIEDGALFFELWGAEATRLGWSAVDLFGVHPAAPAARLDLLGMVPLLRGSTVRGLTTTVATIAAPTGSILTYRRKDMRGAVLLWAPTSTDIDQGNR